MNTKRPNFPQLVLIFFILIQVIVNIIWLSIDRTPPAWDQAAHLHSSITAEKWLTGEGRIPFTDLIKKFGAYPPLIYFITGVYGVFFDFGIDYLCFINTLFLILAVFGIYKLAEEFVKEKMAVLAAIFFLFIPVIYSISREFLLDLPLTAIVIFGLWFWIKSDFLRERRTSWSWWLMLSLASLTKINGFIYFVPMGVMSIIYWFRERDFKQLKNLFFGAGLWLSSISWWWIINWDNIYYNIFLQNRRGELDDPMNLFDWQTWTHYLKLFIKHQFQLIPALIFIILFISWLRRSKDEKEKKITWWLLSNYVIFTIIPNKDMRYVMPLLSVVVIIMVIELDYLKKIWRVALISVLAVFWGFFYFNTSFGWPIPGEFILESRIPLFGNLEWIGFYQYPVYPPQRTIWPNREITKKLYQIALNKGRQECLMIINWPEINDNNLLLDRDLYLIDGLQYYNLESVGLIYEFKDIKEVKEFTDKFDLVLVPDNMADIGPLYIKDLKSRRQLRDWIWQHPEQWKMEAEFFTPRGTSVYLFSHVRE